MREERPRIARPELGGAAVIAGRALCCLGGTWVSGDSRSAVRRPGTRRRPGGGRLGFQEG